MALDFILGLLQNNPLAEYGFVGLFVNGMLSSIIPIPTEVTTSALILSGYSKLLIFVVLSIGSIVGGFIEYYVGYGGDTVFHRLVGKVKRIDKHLRHKRSHSLLERYGWLIIFVCPWIPVLGDVVPLVAGAKKYDIKRFAMAMSAGKAVKVAAIVWLGAALLPLIFGPT